VLALKTLNGMTYGTLGRLGNGKLERQRMSYNAWEAGRLLRWLNGMHILRLTI